MIEAPIFLGRQFIPRDNSPVRIAVAGLGRMGEIHLKAISALQAGNAEAYYKGDLPHQIQRITVCGICDPDPIKNMRYPDIPFYQNWRQLLDAQKPHMAIIASPTLSHYDLAMQALSLGIHTLVEKPITPSARQCQTLIRTAATHRCRVLAGQVERYNPVTIKLHHLIKKEKRSIRHYRFTRTQPAPARIPDDIITDKLIHDLDLALFLFGELSDLKLLSSRSIDGRIMEAEVRLTHRNAVQGELFVSWLVPSEQAKCRQVKMHSQQGDYLQGDFIKKALSVNNMPIPCDVQGWSASANNQIKDQLVDFLAYCLEASPDIPPPQLSANEMQASIRIIEHIRSLSHHV